MFVLGWIGVSLFQTKLIYAPTICRIIQFDFQDQQPPPPFKLSPKTMIGKKHYDHTPPPLPPPCTCLNFYAFYFLEPLYIGWSLFIYS